MPREWRNDGRLVRIRLASGQTMQYIPIDAMEERISRDLKAGKITRDQAQEARLARDRAEFEANRAYANELQSEHPALGVIGRGVNTAMNYGNQLLLGLPQAGAALATAPIYAARRGFDLSPMEAIQGSYGQVNSMLDSRPGYQAAAGVAAALSPGGLANKVFSGATRLASSPLARAAAGSAASGRMGVSAMQQIGAAIAGNVSGTLATSTDIASDALLGGEDLDDAANDLLARAGFAGALGAVTGALTSPLRTRGVNAAKALFDRARRVVPGLQAPPDIGRDPHGTVSGLLSVLANSPIGRGQARRWLNERFFGPMENAVQQLERQTGSQAGLATTAQSLGTSLGNLVPRGSVPGVIRNRIGVLGTQAIQGRGGDVVLSPLGANLRTVLDSLDRRAARMMTEVPRGKQLESILGRYRRALINFTRMPNASGLSTVVGVTGPPVRALDPIRQQLGEISEFADDLVKQGVASQRDVREARVLYHAVSNFMKSVSPPIEAAFNEMKKLRRFGNALKPVAKVLNEDDEIQAARAFFTKSGASNRWTRAVQYGDNTLLQKLRAVYAADFLDEVSALAASGGKEARVVRGDIMRDLWSGKKAGGRFNQKLFDRVLGRPFREAVEDMGDASVHVMERIGRTQNLGAQLMGATALRSVSQGMSDAAAIAAGKAVPGGLNWIEQAFGTAGSFLFARSIFNGQMGQRLIRLATGGEARPGIAPFMLSRGAQPVAPAALLSLAAPSMTETLGGVISPQIEESP